METLCKIEACQRPTEVRGYCKNHYVVALHRGDIKKVRADRPPPRDGQVWCTSCSQYLPESEIRWDAVRNRWDGSCRSCKTLAYKRHLDAPLREAKAAERRANHAAYMRKWAAKNRDVQRIKVTLRTWGLTEAQYRALFDAQDHKCAVCGAEARTGKVLAIDHCHDSGRIRGLLCQDCNLGMGQFADDPNLLEAAVRYLRAGGVVHDEALRIPDRSRETARAKARDLARARRRGQA